MTVRTELTELDIYTCDPTCAPHTTTPPRSRWRRLLFLSLCIGLSLFTAVTLSNKFRAIHGGTAHPDFGEIYNGARCAIHHQDPYDPAAALQTFRAEGGTFADKDRWAAEVIIAINVNLPTSLFLIAPLALLPFGAATALWTALTMTALVIAGYLIWSVADGSRPVLFGCLIGIMLANCQQMLMVGNVAGIVVSLCVVAAWCFVKNRYIPLAILLFAVSLALKPHDSGFVWLYFLLAGGVMRKRALQTLAITCVFGVAAAIWIAPASPHWFHELQSNHALVSQLGSTSDPSPLGVTSGNPGAILDLQAVLSVFMGDPRSYNLASYMIAGPLIAFWAWIVLRRRITGDNAWLAIAAIAVLSLLPVYHRPYDAKLLLLTIPACAKFWSEGGVRRWLSFGLTLGGILFTSDLFMALLVTLSRRPFLSPLATEKVLAVSLVPPTVLLALGCFYLWAFLGDKAGESAHDKIRPGRERMALSTVG